MDSIAVSVYEPRRGPSSQHQKLRRGPCLPAWSIFVWDEAKCRRIMIPKYNFVWSNHSFVQSILDGVFHLQCACLAPCWVVVRKSGYSQASRALGGRAIRGRALGAKPPSATGQPLALGLVPTLCPLYGKLDSHETLKPRMCKFGLKCKILNRGYFLLAEKK